MVKGSETFKTLVETKFYCDTNGRIGVFAKGTEMANLRFRGQTYYFFKQAITDLHDLPEYLYKQWQDLNALEEVEITQETFVYLNWKFRGNMFTQIKEAQDMVSLAQ